MKPIKLMIVDDYDPIRMGLKSTIEFEEDIDVVGDYRDGESAVLDAERTMPNVVLMDVRMPGMDGIEACRLIRDRVPGVNVVMLTSFDDEQAATASILAGAHGFLLKNGGPGELLHVVRAAARGETLLDPALTGRVVANLKTLAMGEQLSENPGQMTPAESQPDVPLSKREREVLAMLVEFRTNIKIAEGLYISESTVKNHVSNILRKLGVDSRHEAAAFMTRRHRDMSF